MVVLISMNLQWIHSKRPCQIRAGRWLVGFWATPLKIWVRQWEGLSHILWTITNVWNHQPDEFPLKNMVIFGVLFSPNSELLHSLTKWLIGIPRDSHEDISMYNCITNTWVEFQSCTLCTLCTLYHLDSGYGYVSIIHQPEQAAARFQKHSPCKKNISFPWHCDIATWSLSKSSRMGRKYISYSWRVRGSRLLLNIQECGILKHATHSCFQHKWWPNSMTFHMAHGQSLTKIPPIISHIAMGHPP